MMLAAILEKLAFGIPAAVLFSQGRLSGMVFAFGTIDLLLAGLFAVAFLGTASAASRAAGERRQHAIAR
jgi:hypothetical protein